MSQLLNANFARLFKSRLFWICAAASVALGLYEIILKIIKVKSVDYPLHPEKYIFNQSFNFSGFFFLVILAILIGFFTGAEHDGVLRNKIIVGQKRAAVYFANLITCSVAIMIFLLLFDSTIILVGLLCGGSFMLPFGTVALYVAMHLASLLSACALFTAITMLIPQKLAGAIAALVLIFAFFSVDLVITGKLHELESEQIVTEDGITTLKKEDYTPEEFAEKTFLTFAQDIIPCGQSSQIVFSYTKECVAKDFELSGGKIEKEPAPIEIFPYSLGMIAVSTAVGTIVFRRRDLK